MNRRKSKSMDVAVIITVYGIAISLCIASVIYIWQTRSQNDRLKVENGKLKDEILKLKASQFEEYPKRDLEKLRQLIAGSHDQVSILGLVAYQIIHQGRLTLVHLINKANVSVRILIADPNSEYFKYRVQVEEDYSGRLIGLHRATLSELAEIASKVHPHKFEVKQYTKLFGDFLIVIVDGKEMYVNERLHQKGFRCYESPMFRVTKDRPAQRITFEHFERLFDCAWNDTGTKRIHWEILTDS